MTRRAAIFYSITLMLGSKIFVVSCSQDKNKNLLKKENYGDLIAELAETIIPETDTVGAKQAGVSLYILNFVNDCLSERDKRTFFSGLVDIETYSNKQYSQSFLKCSGADRVEVLKYFQRTSTFKNPFFNKVKRRLFGQSFFEIIKDLTVKGYCVSKAGATEALEYDPIPGEYFPCVPIRDDQRSWATA